MLIKTMVILQGSGILEKLNEETAKPVTEGVSTKDNFMQMVGLVFLLIVILVAAYYTTKFVGGIKLGQLKNSNFNLIDSYRIGQNKGMQIVKIGNKFVVIAIGKDSIQFITELDESEVMIKESYSGEKQNFKQIFDKLNNKKV